MASPLADLLGAGRPLKVVNFPGTEAPLGLWVLRDLEGRQAKIDAVKYLVDGLKLDELHLAHHPEIGEHETRSQVLFRAMRDPEAPQRPFAESVGELRERLTDHQRDALFQLYLEWQAERSPFRYFKSAEEVDAFLADVGKGSIEQASLADYDIGSLLYALRYSARKLATPTRPSSSGSLLSSASSLSTPPGPAGASTP